MKILKICAKCSDCCSMALEIDGAEVKAQDQGYVPSLMPGGGGDYIELDIDIDTGMILNWRKPNSIELEDFLCKPD